MAEIDSWSETASSNTTVGGVNVAEHCLAANLNDGIRAVMAGVKEAHNDLLDGTVTVNKATQDGAGNVIADTYLPLSGGTMTGAIGHTGILVKSTSGGYVKFMGGSTWDRCAELLLFDGAHSSYAGAFALRAYSSDGSQCGDLWGWPNGTLTWQGKEIERVNSSSTNYIRYDNGLQLCWGEYLSSVSIPTGGTVYQAGISFPVAFSSVPNVIIGGYGDYGCSISAALNRNSRSTVSCVVEFGNWYPTTMTAQIGFSWLAIGYWK